MAKTTRMAFTAEELEHIKNALNDYSLELMHKSGTWGNGNGEMDYYHHLAYEVNALWCRFYEASLRVEKAQTVTATEEVDG